MTHNVAELRLEERVRFDPDRLTALCKELGEIGAEQVIAQALERITLKVAHINALDSLGNLDEIAHVCKGLSRVAGQIGMITLARVACDVRTCVENRQHVPFVATLGRLNRISDQSINALWSLDDVSG